MKQSAPAQKIQRWSERFEALSLRERLLFLISIIAVLYIAWDMLLMERVRHQHDTAVVQVKKWHSQISDIDNRIQAMSAALSGSGQTEAAQRIQRLKAEISNINQRHKTLAVSFIRPGQMVQVLKGLLENEKGLQLTRLQTQAVQPLIMRPPQAASTPVTPKQATPTQATPNQEKPAEQTPDSPPLPQVYKHGLEIVFQGDYNSTLSYLKKLELLPWKFFWEEVVYEVVQYPKAQIMVRIHTLSLDERWISV